MQNKPKVKYAQIILNSYMTIRYEISDTWLFRQTKPKQTQFKANLTQLKPISMQNKPNSNPIPSSTPDLHLLLKWNRIIKHFVMLLFCLINVNFIAPAQAAPPSILSTRANSRTIGLYEKFDLRPETENLGILQSIKLDQPLDGAVLTNRKRFLAICSLI